MDGFTITPTETLQPAVILQFSRNHPKFVCPCRFNKYITLCKHYVVSRLKQKVFLASPVRLHWSNTVAKDNAKRERVSIFKENKTFIVTKYTVLACHIECEMQRERAKQCTFTYGPNCILFFMLFSFSFFSIFFS